MMTHTSPSWITTLATRLLSNPQSFGEVKVTQRTRSFGFQIQASFHQKLPTLTFSLTSENAPSPGQFAIQVNFATGEIIDIANETGVIGCLQQDLTEATSRSERLTLRWSIEHHGGALIPRLEIGEEEWLYPAVRFSPSCEYVATASVSDDARLSHAYVWCQDQIKG